jgi:DNA-binding beta-propeller fold protein YncE
MRHIQLRRLFSLAGLSLVLVACGGVAPSTNARPSASTATQPSPLHLHRAYVATSAGVVAIDLTTGIVGTPVPTPSGTVPVDIAITPDAKTAYVAAIASRDSHAQSSVIPLDLATGTLGNAIPIATTTLPFGLVIAPDGKTAYVLTDLTGSGGAVIPLNLATRTLATPIPTPRDTFAANIAITPDGKTAYVAVQARRVGAMNAVVPLDLANGTFGTPILSPTDTYPVDIAIAPDGKTAYIVDDVPSMPTQAAVNACGCPYVSAVIPLDLATNTPLPKLGNPFGSDLSNNAVNGGPIVIAPDGKTAYVAEQDFRGYGGSVIPVDLTTSPPSIKLANLDIHPVGSSGFITTIVIAPDGKTAYMTDTKYVDSSGKTIGQVNAVVSFDLATFTGTGGFPFNSTLFAIALTP